MKAWGAWRQQLGSFAIGLGCMGMSYHRGPAPDFDGLGIADTSFLRGNYALFDDFFALWDIRNRNGLGLADIVLSTAGRNAVVLAE
jgi:hypothetical protein